MRRKFRRGLVLALTLFVLAAALTGCGSKNKFSAAQLVKGNLDLVYLDQFEPDYLEQVSLTEEEAQARYENGIALEAEYFADYFDIDLDVCTPAIRSEIVELYHQIYAHSKYEVADKAVTEDGVYEVEVTVSPMDIIRNVSQEDIDGFVSDWKARGAAGEFTGISDEEFESAWAQDIIDLIYARIDSIGYLDPKTITVHVERSAETGHHAIREDDFRTLDTWIIAY